MIIKGIEATQNRKDILINHRFDKGLVFRTKKELSELNNKKTNKQKIKKMKKKDKQKMESGRVVHTYNSCKGRRISKSRPA